MRVVAIYFVVFIFILRIAVIHEYDVKVIGTFLRQQMRVVLNLFSLLLLSLTERC